MSKYKAMAMEKGGMAKETWDAKRPHRPHTGLGLADKARGLSGRTKSSDTVPAAERVSRPLTDLRDPSSFAPPPRRTGSGLAQAPTRSTEKRQVVAAPSKYQDPRGPPVEPPPHFANEQQALTYGHEDEEDQHTPHAYQSNTTGLRTEHLPPPPGRRDGADGRSPPPYDAATAGTTGGARLPPPPSLPPRLPPRTGSASSASSPIGSGPGHGMLNQGAVSRLGASGISVPGFGIGRSSPATVHAPSPPPPPRSGNDSSAQVNELQNRFSRMTTPSANANSTSEGTTWQQKQAAVKTASSFQKNPSSVSFSDMKSAAGTANSFRQRHGDQVAAGMKSANSLNQKYGVTDKVGTYAGSQGQQPETSSSGAVGGSAAMAAVAGKKKPPPPPKKKFGLASPAIAGSGGGEPPPIPMSTRPAF